MCFTAMSWRCEARVITKKVREFLRELNHLTLCTPSEDMQNGPLNIDGAFSTELATALLWLPTTALTPMTQQTAPPSDGPARAPVQEALSADEECRTWHAQFENHARTQLSGNGVRLAPLSKSQTTIVAPPWAATPWCCDDHTT